MTIAELKEHVDYVVEDEFEKYFEQFEKYKPFCLIEDNYSDLFEDTDCAKREYAKVLDNCLTEIETFIQKNEISLNGEDIKALSKMVYEIGKQFGRIRDLMHTVVFYSPATAIEDGTAINFSLRKVQDILRNEHIEPVILRYNRMNSRLKRMAYSLNNN